MFPSLDSLIPMETVDAVEVVGKHPILPYGGDTDSEYLSQSLSPDEATKIVFMEVSW